MGLSGRYVSSWDGFWTESSGEPGAPFWDADAESTGRPHLELLAPFADPGLPIVDLGCGNGTQTRYLAGRFPRAVGVDLSAAAVAHARRVDTASVAEFEVLNLADLAAVELLHERLGDANIYMRAVLHQSDPGDRAAIAAAVALLLGGRGSGFVVEPTAEAKSVLQRVAQQLGGPSERMRQVQEHGLRPAEVADGEIRERLSAAGLGIAAEGTTELAMADHLADGTRIQLPACWFVVGRSSVPGDRRAGR